MTNLNNEFVKNAKENETMTDNMNEPTLQEEAMHSLSVGETGGVNEQQTVAPVAGTMEENVAGGEVAEAPVENSAEFFITPAEQYDQLVGFVKGLSEYAVKAIKEAKNDHKTTPKINKDAVISEQIQMAREDFVAKKK